MANALMRPGCIPAVPKPNAQAGKLSALFAKALACHQAGNVAEAITLYERLLSLKPDLPEPYNNLGAALASMGKLDEAAAAYRRAIALDRNHCEAHTNLGYTLRNLGKFDASEEILRRAVMLKPDNAEAHAGLALALMELDRPAEAEAAFCRAIALKPGFAAAYNNLGLALKEAGRFAEAGVAIEKAIGLAPRNASYYDNLGAVRPFAVGDRYFAALEDMAKDSESLPASERMHLHFALAKAYQDIGRSECAFRQLLAGNELKRRQIVYSEAAVLARMDLTRELFTPDVIRTREGSGDASPAPIFIVGMPRSGTTLIEQILASHPAVFGAGELGLFEQTTDAVGDLLPRSHSFPDMVLDMSEEHFRTLGTLYLEKLRQRAPGSTRVTDKMPGNFLFAGLIHLALPGATIIHAVRDPLDTCVSCFSIHFTRGQTQTYDLAELGRYYRHYRTLMAHWHRVLPPGRVVDVNYEELVGDPEGVARRIIAHCGLEWDARCLDFHRTKRTVRTASAAQVRRPIYRSSVGRWRDMRPSSDLCSRNLGLRAVPSFPTTMHIRLRTFFRPAGSSSGQVSLSRARLQPPLISPRIFLISARKPGAISSRASP